MPDLDPEVVLGILIGLDEDKCSWVLQNLMKKRPELAVPLVNLAVPDLTYPPAHILTNGRVTGGVGGMDPVRGGRLIDCQALKNVFGLDVFVDGQDAESFQEGDKVTFSVALTPEGQPQAFALRYNGPKRPNNMASKAVAAARAAMAGDMPAQQNEGPPMDEPTGREPWNFKCLPCKYFAEGRCKYDSGCYFVHDYCEKRRPDFEKRPVIKANNGGNNGGMVATGNPMMDMMSGMMAMMGGMMGSDNGGGGGGDGGNGKGGCGKGKEDYGKGGGKGKGSGYNSPLVEEVKNMQRQSVEFKEAWWQYCDAELRGIRDPSRHSDEILQRFLDDYNTGAFAGMAPLALPAYTPPDPSVIEILKQMQRSDPQAKELWNAYCNKLGGGKRDPTVHNALFVEDFIEKFSSGRLEGELGMAIGGGPGPGQPY